MSRKTQALPILLALAMASILGSTNAAHAFQTNVKFCNRTTEALVIAAGFDVTGTSETTSKGWTNIAPCSCRDVINANTRATEFFLLTARKGTTAALQSGRAPLCIHPTKAFRFVGENASRDTCTRAGGRWVNFAFHDTKGASNFHVNFRFASGPRCNL
jgi:uncharacterized membrane protein